MKTGKPLKKYTEKEQLKRRKEDHAVIAGKQKMIIPKEDWKNDNDKVDWNSGNEPKG